MPHFFVKNNFVSLPLVFIDEYLPDANATFVKVYIYALGLAEKNKEFDFLDIAKALNLLESDVVQAFEYWAGKGWIDFSEDSVIFVSPAASSAEEIQENEKPVSAPTFVQKRPGYTSAEVANAIRSDSTLSETVSLAQEILGKTLNPTDTETLYWFYDGLKFSPEVILMLLEYCVSKEKRRMSYIEKVAVSWHERGITSMEAVNDYLQAEAEHTGYIYSIRKILGIADRQISKNEEHYINRWHEMYHMDENMVSAAYEQCIIRTAKLSFPYIDKILESWYKAGIHTPEEAKKESEEHKHSSPSAIPADQKQGYGVYNESYDHGSLEQLTRKRGC